MTREFIPVRMAVLTVSDTRTRETDKSGDTLAERIHYPSRPGRPTPSRARRLLPPGNARASSSAGRKR